MIPELEKYIKKYKVYGEVKNDYMHQVGHRKEFGSQNYIIVSYSGIEDSEITYYENKYNINIPSVYKTFLNSNNGLFAFGITMFGIPLSMLKNGLLNRSILQCHDIRQANRSWKKEYNVDEKAFHFGGRDVSFHEICGYFLYEDIFYVTKKNGKTIKTYNNFSDFISNELQISENIENSINKYKWE